MDSAADNDEMFSSYISKGQPVSIDDMLWGNGDCDYLDDNYDTVDLVSVEHNHSMGDDKAYCDDKLLCNEDIADSKEDIPYNSSKGEAISVSSEDCRDDKSLSIVPYASGDLQGNVSGTKMINYAIIDDYYRAAVSLGRIITQIMDYNEREYFRSLYDRGKSDN